MRLGRIHRDQSEGSFLAVKEAGIAFTKRYIEQFMV